MGAVSKLRKGYNMTEPTKFATARPSPKETEKKVDTKKK